MSIYSAPELIRKKRDGKPLGDDELRWLVEGYCSGAVTDYQMSAWAMAVFFNGLNPKETATLTLAMRDSGKVIALGDIQGIKVDKHSTGGVGDKVSICLAPMVAACGVPVPMMSGRGLGHTGGTLDKLEAIPGFSTQLTPDHLIKQMKTVGCALIGQTPELVPADRKLYALRDVTATVESIPLITASILSKKLAEGINALVMDVKVGRGAFMKTLGEARKLARSIVRVSALAKVKTVALLTDMNAPLGHAIGNALETREAFDILHGRGPADVLECTMALGAEMLMLAGKAKTPMQARRLLADVVSNGQALECMRAIITTQGGDARVLDAPDQFLPCAPYVTTLSATRSGFVSGIDPMALGLAAIQLGAGRMRADQPIDPSVGFVLKKKPGDPIDKGQPWIEVHAKTSTIDPALNASIQNALELSSRKPKIAKLVLDQVR